MCNKSVPAFGGMAKQDGRHVDDILKTFCISLKIMFHGFENMG